MNSGTATIDVNDPLFLHPVDTPGINLISEQLTGTENYGVWSRAMLIALRAKNKLAFVDGTSRRPTGKENILPIWKRGKLAMRLCCLGF